jgi:hypothetical protein
MGTTLLVFCFGPTPDRFLVFCRSNPSFFVTFPFHLQTMQMHATILISLAAALLTGAANQVVLSVAEAV